MGKQGRQKSRVAIVRGRGSTVMVLSGTIPHPQPNAQADITQVEEFHFSAGNHCKGSGLNTGQEDLRKQGSREGGR